MCPSYVRLSLFCAAASTVAFSGPLAWSGVSALPTAYLNGVRFGDGESASSETVMHLQMLNDTSTTGAVCLDGTPAGFYFSAATTEAAKDDWQIYFQGGTFVGFRW